MQRLRKKWKESKGTIAIRNLHIFSTFLHFLYIFSTFCIKLHRIDCSRGWSVFAAAVHYENVEEMQNQKYRNIFQKCRRNVEKFRMKNVDQSTFFFTIQIIVFSEILGQIGPFLTILFVVCWSSPALDFCNFLCCFSLIPRSSNNSRGAATP